MSKCSQSMSPVKAGVMAKNLSLPNSIISRPFILLNGSKFIETKENSLIAQLSQYMTCSSVHSRGSAKGQSIICIRTFLIVMKLLKLYALVWSENMILTFNLSYALMLASLLADKDVN
ncbi:hypothetical protein GQX74_006270 [Glossina fuscipes]|nr:hypothetical protein GQX74_006270 [Glossina fuscipes]